MAISPVVSELLDIFEQKKSNLIEDNKYNVSRTISILAVLYEKARNAVEFRAEHLVRRASIERILKRRILLNGGSQTIAENLVIELLWAKYIDSSLIDDEKVKTIQEIVTKYLSIKQSSFSGRGSVHGISWDMVMGYASTEIEELLVSPKKREALNHFFYQVIRPKVIMPNEDEHYINLQAYVAVERAFAQSDNATLGFHVLKIIQPEWLGGSAHENPELLATFLQNVKIIDGHLTDTRNEAIYRFVRKQTPPMLLLRDFLFEEVIHAKTLLDNEVEFEQKLSQICARRYQEIGAKVKRSVVRSFIYIFLTKMVFAFALEAPFDVFISKKIAYIPLAINMLFPPVLLYIVAGFINVPGGENTKRLIGRVRKIIYDFDGLKNETDVYVVKPPVKRPLLTAIFSVIYIVTFLLVFGLISFFLTRLHFNIASQIIFVFFITLVTFFAYRIRQGAKEYDIGDRQGFLGPFVDFLFLPILRVGHLLSREIARLNVLIFFFDFILEAPLKVIFEVFEEWIRFIRTKKEEIV